MRFRHSYDSNRQQALCGAHSVEFWSRRFAGPEFHAELQFNDLRAVLVTVYTSQATLVNLDVRDAITPCISIRFSTNHWLRLEATAWYRTGDTTIEVTLKRDRPDSGCTHPSFRLRPPMGQKVI